MFFHGEGGGEGKKFLVYTISFCSISGAEGNIYIQQIDPVNNTFHLFIAYFVGKKHFIFILLFNAKYLISVNFALPLNPLPTIQDA